jgi:hypothetical protein
MSAVSKKLRPASMQVSTILRASATSPVAPYASKNSFLPPNVPQPKQSSGTFIPDLPSCLYSIVPMTLSVRLQIQQKGAATGRILAFVTNA